MEKYRKDFERWAEVAEEVEKRERLKFVKVGAIYWCHLGVGIGSELMGKGKELTRPVLVLGKIDERLILIVPITTKTKRGGHYVDVVVNGVLENAILYQSKIIDVKRIGDFIDEVSLAFLKDIHRTYIRFLERLFQKES